MEQAGNVANDQLALYMRRRKKQGGVFDAMDDFLKKDYSTATSPIQQLEEAVSYH